jgi:hypothetical protein
MAMKVLMLSLLDCNTVWAELALKSTVLQSDNRDQRHFFCLAVFTIKTPMQCNHQCTQYLILTGFGKSIRTKLC